MPRGSKPKFDARQDEEIASLYLAGHTTYEIAEQFSSSPTPVTAALHRQGVQLRPTGKKRTWWTGSPEQRAGIVAAYNGGESIKGIARRRKIRAQVIIECLDDAGVKRRQPGSSRMFDDEAAREMAVAYQAGESLNAIAKRHGTNPRTVASYVERAGVIVRIGSPPLFWTEERRAEAVRRYEAGESQQQIALAFGCEQTGVSRILIAAGCEPRQGMPRGADHAGWKGGRRVDGNGYIQVLLQREDYDLIDPMSNGYVLEHRLIMARALHRKLRRSETVHHINGDKQDNRLENLQLRQGKHGKGVRMACLDCGSHNVGPVPLP